jgi:hypothetical protein
MIINAQLKWKTSIKLAESIQATTFSKLYDFSFLSDLLWLSKGSHSFIHSFIHITSNLAQERSLSSVWEHLDSS